MSTPRGSITTILRSVRQPGAHGERLVELLLVLREQHHRLGVAEQVLRPRAAGVVG